MKIYLSSVALLYAHLITEKYIRTSAFLSTSYVLRATQTDEMKPIPAHA